MLDLINYLWGYFNCTECLIRENNCRRCLRKLMVFHLTGLVPKLSSGKKSQVLQNR